MSNQYQPLVISRTPSILPIALAREASRWSSRKTVVNETFPHPVSDVCFSPVSPYKLAVSYGNSVSLVPLQNPDSRKTLSRFRDLTYSPCYKHDGRLLVAGTARGEAYVYDTNSRSELRKLIGHKGAVRSAQFSRDGLHVMTGSDDSTVRTWDLAQGKCLFTFRDADDYVRAQTGSPSSLHVWAAGSYDKKARIYDLRKRKCVFTLDHGYQIDDIHFYPGGARLVTVGGTEAKVWDLFSGGNVTAALTCHAKSVTSAAVDVAHEQLVTAGLDGYVKAHNLSLSRTIGVMSFDSQIVGLDISSDGICCAVGMVDGSVKVRVRSKGPAVSEKPPEIDDPDRAFEGWGRGFERVGRFGFEKRSGSRRYFERGVNVQPSKSDTVVESFTKQKTSRIDKQLKQFNHTNAFDLAVASKDIDLVLAVVDELISRESLVAVLTFRELNALLPLLRMIRKSICSPVRSKKIVFLLDVILDVFANDVSKCREAFKHFKSIMKNVQRAVKVNKKIIAMEGSVEMMMWVPRALV